MSGDETRIDLDAARTENLRLRQIGDQFMDSVDRMKAAATRYDGCWGGDKFGESFAKNYVPNAKKTLTDITTFGKNVGGTADSIEESLTEFENTDQGNANSL